jgi:hypothetical protein
VNGSSNDDPLFPDSAVNSSGEEMLSLEEDGMFLKVFGIRIQLNIIN